MTAINGTAINGTAINGTAINGTAINGTAINGTAINGTANEMRSKRWIAEVARHSRSAVLGEFEDRWGRYEAVTRR